MSTAISGSLRTVQVTLEFSPSFTDIAEAWMVGLGDEDGSAMKRGKRIWGWTFWLVVRMAGLRAGKWLEK
jgi:hypothetical protein